ncbi:hypothetical protein ACETU7_24550 [Rhodococcus sp. 3Y1]
MRGIAGEATFLRADQHDGRTRFQEWKVLGDDAGSFSRRQVLGAPSAFRRRFADRFRVKFRRRVRLEPDRSTELHRMFIVVHPDTARGKISQISADPAADVEHLPAAEETSDIPLIRRLHVQNALPFGALKLTQPSRVLGVGGITATRIGSPGRPVFSRLFSRRSLV